MDTEPDSDAAEEVKRLTRLLSEANALIDDRDSSFGPTMTPRSAELKQWWEERRLTYYEQIKPKL